MVTQSILSKHTHFAEDNIWKKTGLRIIKYLLIAEIEGYLISSLNNFIYYLLPL